MIARVLRTAAGFEEAAQGQDQTARALMLRLEARSREYDRQFVDGAVVADLDVSLLLAVAGSALEGRSVELFLQGSGLVEHGLGGLKLRMAALLLFATDVRRWHPRCEVRILRVVGHELRAGAGYNVTSDETVVGNIAVLIGESWARLSNHLVQKTQLGGDARFAQRYLRPEEACREALVNAIAHRDYNIQSGIEVFLFDDRVEIRSPGPLLSNVSVEGLAALDGVHDSRNALIARVLRENQLMRERGEGMRRIFEAVQEAAQEPPVLTSNSSSFRIALR